MEYHPRYAQPFTLAEAVNLDVSVITDEIARLRNSLKRLHETQGMLRDYILTETRENSDPEVQKALDDNEVVIGSQTERVSILKMALTEKGGIDGSHYDIRQADSPPTNSEGVTARNSSSVNQINQDTGAGDGEGIHL